jgi:hypothetical protein
MIEHNWLFGEDVGDKLYSLGLNFQHPCVEDEVPKGQEVVYL